jgi:regulator of nucleoside diphosphate kinase
MLFRIDPGEMAGYKRVNRGGTMTTRQIYITENDMRRLRHLLSTLARTPERDHAHLESLEAELDRATVLDAAELPAGVVGMRTRVRVRDIDSGERRDYTLVYPAEADVNSHRLSVLAPLGTALLGFREGDQIEWRMPGGIRRILIERILDDSDVAQEAMKNPNVVFGCPEAVDASAELTTEQKRSILLQWKDQLRQLLIADEESMLRTGASPGANADCLRRVSNSLARLGTPSRRKERRACTEPG